MAEPSTYGLPVDMIYSLSLDQFLPDYKELQPLYEKLFRKPKYNRVGPGAVWDDLIEWVLDASAKLNAYPNAVPQNMVIPNLTSKGKNALKYEELFLKTALAMWRMMPRYVDKIFPVVTYDDKTIFMLAYHGTTWKQNEDVAHFRVEDFSRAACAKRTRALRKTGHQSVS